MTVFEHMSSGFTVRTDRSGAIIPEQSKHPSAERYRPTAAVQPEDASSNPGRLSKGSPGPREASPVS